MDSQNQNRIELLVPASERMMLIVRVTTAGALSRFNLTLDAMDDLKMAVDEAAGCLMRFSGCANLRLSYKAEAERVCVYVQAEGSTRTPETQQRDEILAIRCILESMADQVSIDQDGDSIRAITLSKALHI